MKNSITKFFPQFRRVSRTTSTPPKSTNKPKKTKKAEESKSRKQRNAILSPTEMELNTEQLILDIYLESPSKKRRQIKAVRAWEKQEKRRNTGLRFNFSSCIPEFHCGLRPPLLRGQFRGINLVAEGTRKRSATM